MSGSRRRFYDIKNDQEQERGHQVRAEADHPLSLTSKIFTCLHRTFPFLGSVDSEEKRKKKTNYFKKKRTAPSNASLGLWLQEVIK